MTGPWTADNQPETKSARTWWIVGGIVVAAIVVFVTFLAGLGWEDAVEQEEARTIPTSSAPAAPDLRDAPLKGSIGGKNPTALSADIKELTGASMSIMEADGIATSVCEALDQGATKRMVADEAADATAGKWGDQQARMVALMMMMEYCPRHAD